MKFGIRVVCTQCVILLCFFAVPFVFAQATDTSPLMAQIDGGTFTMGDTYGAFGDGLPADLPVHRVTISSFLLGRYEVTQKLWVEMMQSNPTGLGYLSREVKGRADPLPVRDVTWLEAVEFCNRLSVRDGRDPCYTINGTSVSCDFGRSGYRLPTEAEWEYAAKGGKLSRGYAYAGGNDLNRVAWHRLNSGGITRVGGGKAPNELGLFDMSGNVAEWCGDWYGPYPARPVTDPRGPPEGGKKVYRGTSYDGWDDPRLSTRRAIEPAARVNEIGLRLAQAPGTGTNPESGIEMIFVEGSTYPMGDTSGLPRPAGQTPPHRVTVSTFWLAAFELTQKEWIDIMGTNPSRYKGDELPVEQMSWYAAVDFCNRLSVREGLQPCYTIGGTSVTCDFKRNGYRLPTEAEWEYAARGGNASQGYRHPGGPEASELGWYRDNSRNTTHPIGQKMPNELGLYDMLGNVAEWCWDAFDNYRTEEQSDPRGPAANEFRVHRGGSWADWGDEWLYSWNRSQTTASLTFPTGGIRLARSQP